MQISEVEKILRQDFPDMEIKQIVALSHGWRNFVFLINNKLIIRFPKKPIHNFATQQTVLDALESRVSYRLPSIHYVNTEASYTVYPAILACSYNKVDFVQFTESEKVQIADDLADFLKQMHSAFSSSELTKMEIATFDYYKEIKDIQAETESLQYAKLPSSLLSFIRAEAEISTQHLAKNYEEVLLHNDLHARNIIVDCDTKNLNGVIDFDDMKIGHFHLDFAGFFLSLPVDICLRIAEVYNHLTGRTVLTEYAKAIAVDYLASNLIKRPEDTILRIETIANLEDLAKV